MTEYFLTDIYIYPIKSLGGIRLQHSEVSETGLKFDRQWMLVDLEGTFVSQRKYHQLSLLQVGINKEKIIVTHKLNQNLRLEFSATAETGKLIPVTVWDDSCVGMEVSRDVNDWFSSFLGMEVKLVKMVSTEPRLVDPRYANNQEVVSFSDGYPFLIISQASLDRLNQQLEQPVLIDRFRPNFVFSGGEAHVEDSFADFQIRDVIFSAVKPCARCVLVTVDQQSGVKSNEPLKTLASYRTRNKKVMFGQNLIHKGEDLIAVGDTITILSSKKPI
ncbi:MAG: MOSC domain-containing protein [Pedobacter sp.]|nr:MAG: MOSC domain-containing protein [Pedobacter sp.]